MSIVISTDDALYIRAEAIAFHEELNLRRPWSIVIIETVQRNPGEVRPHPLERKTFIFS
jgi:hypothetical protein